jgi:L,D-peptidoglycan transpeptidase YkuD (ErfK/YbiS/YcfS/YnhG family)
MKRTLSRRLVVTSAVGLAVAGIERGQADPAPVDIVVSPSRIARVGALRFRCAIGSGGIKRDKREGDGATPAGVWPLREVLYRADRIAKPVTKLPVRALTQDDGWCDAPADPRYNTNVRLPYDASAEHLWRGDHLYDLIVVVGYNDAPVTPGAGSAIFLHIARSGYAPTAGCVAFSRTSLQRILSLIDVRSRLAVRT